MLIELEVQTHEPCWRELPLPEAKTMSRGCILGETCEHGGTDIAPGEDGGSLGEDRSWPRPHSPYPGQKVPPAGGGRGKGASTGLSRATCRC